ncbi:uncharacterized protein LTR77_005463 [Saxophila tyrrhenica]|uniref:Xylose isomerase-like TIM barrel domain-containing protein n=1 Tax=Saxophila tyrrhenica TaxID=1690608 RepID=A0AAV9PCK8_9PEZI|nr:hypothetical protein LTR77_005463 [Saxophila tyrrhenica]
MSCRPAISSHSLGRAWVHNIETKLDQAARYGFDIEMFYEDLQYLAQTLEGGPTADNQLQAATMIRAMCDDRNIAIVCLQPFMHYEGLRDRVAHQDRVDEMKSWIKLAQALKTSIISIPSTCLSSDDVSGDIELVVSDMREVADLAAPENIQIAYESLAWGTHVDTWEQSWEVVEKVDRPNFGICLDTFNIAARVYADPTAASRRNVDAEQRMQASLDKMTQTIDARKITYVQVVDAEYLQQPLVDGHPYYRFDQPARMSWSRNCRLFYGEKDRGAYLPIKDILGVILNDLGFRGWISAEMFNESLTDPSELVPEQHAQRAADSWRMIVEDFDLGSSMVHRPEGPPRTTSQRAYL